MSVSESETASPSPSRMRVALWGALLFAACRAIELFLEAASMATLVGQAVLVEWGASRLGVHWTPPRAKESEPPPSTALLAKRAAIGAGVGLVAALVVFGVLRASRGATTESVPHVEISVLAIGLATAALGSWRDELLFHGVTLRALEGTSALVRALACAVTSAGAALGRSDASPRTVAVAALLGVVFGTLWIRDRGAWQPWAANTLVRWTTGTLLAGGLVHTRVADDAWGGGTTGMLGGTAAVVAVTPLAIACLVHLARRPPE